MVKNFTFISIVSLHLRSLKFVLVENWRLRNMPRNKANEQRHRKQRQKKILGGKGKKGDCKSIYGEWSVLINDGICMEGFEYVKRAHLTCYI